MWRKDKPINFIIYRRPQLLIVRLLLQFVIDTTLLVLIYARQLNLRLLFLL
jgi:hypothetical protein